MDSRVLKAWEDWEHTRSADERAVTRTAFRRLLTGRAPTIADLACALGASDQAVTQTVHTMVDQGLATADGDYVTGVGGLSLVPAPHRLQWNGRRYWTWCALDAIGIPAALGGDARVDSRVAPDGTVVHLYFQDGAWTDSDATLGIRLAEPQVARPLCGGT
ncbi:organomercurial lyase [Sulfobacillus harzensis]|uniref:Uncharacterized protein n=1 Tax=Sulfobacillus harzensis TaxID=2729629 RepID=A0A7Y0L1W6_9FIRM|nr:hypothetical protein [Sulfobacillus harzensis]